MRLRERKKGKGILINRIGPAGVNTKICSITSAVVVIGRQIADSGRRFYPMCRVSVRINRFMSAFAEEQGLRYVRSDDSFAQSFDAPPTIVNFLYHEEVKKSAKKVGATVKERNAQIGRQSGENK